MQCNIFIEHKRSIQFIPISISHLKEDTKDKEEKDILTKFTTMAPVHSRVSRCKKIMLSLTDKVKLCTNLHKQKPKLGCHPLAELFKETYLHKRF